MGLREYVFGRQIDKLKQDLATATTSRQKSEAWKNAFVSINKASNEVQAPAAAAIATILAPQFLGMIGPATQTRVINQQKDKVIGNAKYDIPVSAGNKTPEMLGVNMGAGLLGRGSEIAAQIGNAIDNVQVAIAALQGKREQTPVNWPLIAGGGLLILFLLMAGGRRHRR